VEQTTQNVSQLADDGCLRTAKTQIDYVPWDNPDNVISREVRGKLRNSTT
jgi:hypothetical protein